MFPESLDCSRKDASMRTRRRSDKFYDHYISTKTIYECSFLVRFFIYFKEARGWSAYQLKRTLTWLSVIGYLLGTTKLS